MELNAEPLALLGKAALTSKRHQTLCKLPTEVSTGPAPLLSRDSTSRGTLLSTSPPPPGLPPQTPNPHSAHLDRVQGVSHKHQAHAAKAAGQEVLKRTDGFRLVCHGQSSVSLSGSSGQSRSCSACSPSRPTDLSPTLRWAGPRAGRKEGPLGQAWLPPEVYFRLLLLLGGRGFP